MSDANGTSAANTTPIRVLVVDDDIDTAALISDALRRRGFDAVELHSAKECLDCLRTSHAQVVVTDVQMPGMSGLELTAALRCEFPDVRIVIVTGLGAPTLASEAMELGAFVVLRKPVKMHELATSVNQAAAGI